MYKQSNRGKLGLQTVSSHLKTKTQQALHCKINHELDYVKQLKSELAVVGFDSYGPCDQSTDRSDPDPMRRDGRT